MDFSFKNNQIVIESEKKTILLQNDSLNVDGLIIDVAGEYEKSGFLAYAHESADIRIYQMRVEGYTVGFIPNNIPDLNSEQLDFLGDLDVLVMPSSKATLPLLEKIEPNFLLSYGELAHELATSLGFSEPQLQKYKLRDIDLSGEKMGFVLLGE
ncbi:MAG: hypothetical protein HHAS10_03290 [Candidatus Altimarinota bacterium]